MANKILLDYFMPITAINPTPQASTAFLKQACAVVKPKVGVTTGVITVCTTEAEIAALTDNLDARQLLIAGMGRVYVLPMDDLNLSSALNGPGSNFYTLLISSDFDKDDIEETQASGTVTISSYANLVSGTADTITVAGQVFTAQSGAATLGAATFQAATSNNATATSLAAQINAHATASTLVYAVASSAVVTLYAKTSGAGNGTTTGNSVAVAYTDNDTNVGATLAGLTDGKLAGGSDTFSDISYATPGTKVYFNDVTGEADIAMSGFSTVSDATYSDKGVLSGIAEDKSLVPAAQINMPGGL